MIDKEKIITNVYQIDKDKKVALHKHDKHNELFYCVSGSGYGILENSEVSLSVGEVFNVPAGVMHALRSDNLLCVASVLIPVVEN